MSQGMVPLAEAVRLVRDDGDGAATKAGRAAIGLHLVMVIDCELVKTGGW